ncbi:TIGR01841 family phasin [Thalassomonas haliotis]|uniref:TIGR01841 family phasin n=1 Tax=Thalassomonas haliotis TaxID=485448 RepID=A0ABY7VAE7_9GAMM|nr:TIGR01841 family phasin [Thalassomonas haliotis]WDE10210.1 TIGR01841 family phasin [Thalassomonas haliotis]
MFNQFNQQFTNVMKPLNTLADINAKAAEQLVNQQASFVTSLMQDSVAHTKELAGKSDIASAVESHKIFVDTFQSKITKTATDAYAIVTKTTEEVSNLWKDNLAEVAK